MPGLTWGDRKRVLRRLYRVTICNETTHRGIISSATSVSIMLLKILAVRVSPPKAENFLLLFKFNFTGSHVRLKTRGTFGSRSISTQLSNLIRRTG